MSGTIKAICISEVRGVQKKEIPTANLLVGWGVEKDAHGGDWHRQVSLLSYDKVKDFNNDGAAVNHGDFGENIVVEGIDFSSLPIGTILKCGTTAKLEMTQIGKYCHHHCQIYNKMGDCIMPREGVFARVLENGEITVGDKVEIISTPDQDSRFTAAIVTVSDKGAAGEREDKSGKLIEELLTNAGYNIVEYMVIPDEQEIIEEELINLADRRNVSLILTTGGTGLAKRDVTPEATLAVADKNVPGIATAMRINSMSITPRAMLGRGISVIREESLIINLPGSPKAVKENLEFVLPQLEHGLGIMLGKEFECGGKLL